MNNNRTIYLEHIIKKINKNMATKGIIYKEKNSFKNITVACILDNFSYDCLKFEGSFHQLGVSNWKTIIKNINPDILFVESTWQGYNQEWINKIPNMEMSEDKTLIEITDYCKNNNIPTAFWAKEDPNDFYVFIEAAKHFEYVFTPDVNCIEKHKKILGHDNVYFLPLAAQPKLHNPIDRDKEKIGKVAFAGSWYKKFENRKKHMNNLLKPAKKYGLVIYNRFSYLYDDQFAFPNEYKPYIRKGLNYRDIVKEYKKYDVFLNVNSDDTSPTAFSRRIFELLACGIPTISSYNPGIINYFKDIVMISKSEEDTEKHLGKLLKDKEYRDRLSLLGQRKVFNDHTYEQVFKKVLNTVGLTKDEKEDKGVSIISHVNSHYLLDNILNNYSSQKYPKKELILIINNKNLELISQHNMLKGHDDIKILIIPENLTIGKCLNLGVEKSKYDYISIFDSESFYGPNYLIDMINTFKYTEAHIAGKQTIYAYTKYNENLVLVNPNYEYRFTDNISDSTLTFRKNIFQKIKFKDNSQSYINLFLRDSLEEGFKIYSSDRFNHMLIKDYNGEKLSQELVEKLGYIIV